MREQAANSPSQAAACSSTMSTCKQPQHSAGASSNRVLHSLCVAGVSLVVFRVSAMVRLEGLVKGGAAGNYEACFMEHLRMLKDPLLDQMIDRY